MVRTQIQLTEEQSRRLRALARREGISVAELVRRSVDDLLARRRAEPQDLYARAGELVGAVGDPAGPRDWAREHDRYFDESLE